MRVLFIGLGSIAKRHIANLRDLFGGSISITVLRSGKNAEPAVPDALGIDFICYGDGDLAPHYDVVFITNPTSLHYDTLCRYRGKAGAFFIEKPVFLTGDECIDDFRDDGKIYYVACPLRYTNIIQYLKRNIDFSTVYSMRCISSSYLPKWRPGIDYRDTYSAHKDMGGGVSIDLVHEWDYIHYLVGGPKQVKSIIRKKSDLEIDSDDIAVYIAEYEDKVVELHLDYFGRVAVRRIELFTRDDIIHVDLINQKLEWARAGETVELAQDRDEYQKRELEHFFDIVNGKCENNNTLKEACQTLKLARGAE